MANPLILKLEHFTRLSPGERDMLSRVSSERVRTFDARTDIIREGEEPKNVNLFLSGWACRHKQLRDGRRQIVAFFLPGDLCDHNVFVLREMDHSISTLTPVTIAELSQDTFDRITLDHPRVLQAMWWETLVNAAIQREWTTSLGQRDAFERMAHLICELFFRLRCVGMTEGTSCDFPVTQADLAEATGITSVHVNRTIQEMRAQNLVILKGRRLIIPDLRALMRAGLFKPAYLHLDHDGPHLDPIA